MSSETKKNWEKNEKQLRQEAKLYCNEDHKLCLWCVGRKTENGIFKGKLVANNLVEIARYSVILLSQNTDININLD